jgi:hypothetical protein
MQDKDQWQDKDQRQERLAERVEHLEADQRDTRGDVNVLQDWRIDHMSICHPKILGRLAIIFGVATGIALVIGFVLGNLYPILAR